MKEFIEREQQNPSKHRIEDHNMLNWLKASRKKVNAGELKEEGLAKFKELVLVEENKRKNQYA